MNRRDIYLLRALVDHVNGGRVWTHDLGERILLAYEKVKRCYYKNFNQIDLGPHG